MNRKFAGALQLITFDVTGTLLKFRIPPPEQYVKIGCIYGIEAKAEDMTSSFKINYKQMTAEHPIYGKISGLGWEKWWHELICRTFKMSVKSSHLESSKIDIIAQHLINGYSSGEYYEVYPQVKEILQCLQDRSIKLGVISNNDERIHSVLSHLGLLSYFNFILTSYDTGYEKPHCKIFQKALDLYKIRSEQALHVGDSPQQDYFAALKCGWNAVLIHKEDTVKLMKKYPEIPSHLIFNDFNELQSFLL